MEEQVVGTRAWAFWLRNKNKLPYELPTSSFEWRKLYPNERDCPICHGASGRNIQAKDGTIYQCACLMPGWADEQMKLRDSYQSRFEPASFDDLETRAAEKNSRDLANAVKAAEEFVKTLDRWLVLAGPYGTGKSHILKAIATVIKPIGLFMTATDFERKVFEHVKSGTLDEFVLTVSQSAVLLFDDFGAEYGSDIVKSQIAAVFIARDHQAKDLPVVVTTNLSREQIGKVPRVGSRLLNEETVTFLPINMSDYRTKNYRASHPEIERPKW